MGFGMYPILTLPGSLPRSYQVSDSWCGAGLFLIFTQVLLHDVPFLSREPYRGVIKFTTNQYDSVITDLFDELNNEKIRVLNMKVGKSKNSVKVELELLFPAGYGKNDLIIRWSNDKRIESISG